MSLSFFELVTQELALDLGALLSGETQHAHSFGMIQFK